MKKILFIFFLSFLFLLHCSLEDEPEKITLTFLEASAKFQWSELGQVIHPDSKKEFKKMIIALNALQDSIFYDKYGYYNSDSLLSRLRKIKSKNLEPDSFLVHFLNEWYDPKIMKIANKNYNPTYQVFGSVNEGKDTLHVVYRINLVKEGVKLSKLFLLSLKKWNDKWLVIIPDNFNNVKARVVSQGMDWN